MVRKLIRGRTAAGKRADKRASTPRAKAAKERRERKLNTKRYRNVPVKKATKPPKGIPIPPKPEKMSTAFKTKSGAKQVLKKFGVPAAIIAGVLGGSTLLNKKKAVAKKEAKKEEPMKRRFRAGPTSSSLRGQRKSGTLRGKNVTAHPPKRKNKDTAKRPTRPSGPSMTGFRK